MVRLIAKTLWVLALLCLADAHREREADFVGEFFEGSGDPDYVAMLDFARRGWSPDVEFQSVPMLYYGEWDGLLEGPTWKAWWTQNSYGTTLTSLPFLDPLTFSWTAHSQRWWFDHMANGAGPQYSGDEGWAPDGCLCDNGDPFSCNYKQGDGNVPIHDWTLEETLSAIVMQAELLLVTRNMSDIAHFLPLFLRTSNLLESRRDTTNNMFLTGVASNLLAPSFGGWRLPNGKRVWSYMTGISVTYIAALNRLIELERLAGRAEYVSLYTQRRDLASNALSQFLSPTKDYFVRSLDPNGTIHGVLGQQMHGYFEASPNHDAMALRVVDDELALRMYKVIESLEDKIRPYTFILPNYPSYDDMEGDPPYTGLWSYGYWVNGGVWTTQEGRLQLAYYRVNATDDCFRSMQAIADFGRIWRMDNPLPDFGHSVYQPGEEINLTIDAFGAAGGFIRGLFEYLYQAFSLTLVPHLPPTITSLRQKFGIRWGPYRLFLTTTGSAAAGISQVTINGTRRPCVQFNATAITLPIDCMPQASPAALEAVESDFLTDFTAVSIEIVFAARESPLERPSRPARPAVPWYERVGGLLAPGGVSEGLVLWLDAQNASARTQGRLLEWLDQSPRHNNAVALRRSAPLVVSNCLGSLPCVRFDGNATTMSGLFKITANKTLFAAFRDTGSSSTCCSGVLSLSSHEGMTTRVLDGGIHLNLDTPEGPGAGFTNIANKSVVVSMTFNQYKSAARLFGCIDAMAGGQGTELRGEATFTVGSRLAEDGRFFKGDIYELIAYDRELSAQEVERVTAYLETRWGLSNPNPNCTLPVDCTLSKERAAAVAVAQCFTAALSKNQTLVNSLAYAQARLLQQYAAAFAQRCTDQRAGRMPPLPTPGATLAALDQYATTIDQLYAGLAANAPRWAAAADPWKRAAAKAWAGCL